MIQALPIAPGQILSGKYRIESVLGRGGMGVVLAATHLQLEQRVAIKFLVEGGSDPQMRERFAREARAASKIRSEHVARVLDVGALDSGVPYTVMEYLAGDDLAKTIRDRGALPVAEAVGYVLEACEALAEAHVAGIVHRDLKPANMFLARRADGSVAVKLLDFGISKAETRGADGAITSGATILGSPTYMPPEQIRSARNVDARGDLWSLGATLFELLVGWPPFRADTLPELCVRILEEPAPELATFVPGAPPGLGAALRRCLAKDPAARFATVAELAEALEPFARAESRVSVERVARVMGAVRPPGVDAARAGASDQEMHRLQDANTMRSNDGVIARSVQPSREPEGRRWPRAFRVAAAVVLPVGMIATGIVALSGQATVLARATPAAAPTVPPSLDDPAAPASAAPHPLVEQDAASAAISAPAPASTAGSARPIAVLPRRVAKPAGALSTSLPLDARENAQARSERAPALRGTEGFGDRK